ncbi:MAG: cell division protein ZapA [Rikenellaceae bacterium]
MAESKIKVVIADRAFELDTAANPTTQELYQLAEKRVNEKIAEYQSNTQGLSIENIVALVAFDYEVEAIQARRQNFVGSEERKRLSELDAKLDNYLNAPERN